MQLNEQQLAERLLELSEASENNDSKLTLSPAIRQYLQANLDNIYSKSANKQPILLSDLDFIDQILSLKYMHRDVVIRLADSQFLKKWAAFIDKFKLRAADSEGSDTGLNIDFTASSDLNSNELKLLSLSTFTSDLTNLPSKLKNKITAWYGNIVDQSSHRSYRNLTRVGSFFTERAGDDVKLPKLEMVAGNLTLLNVLDIDASNLSIVKGSIETNSLLDANFPELEEVGINIILNNSESVNFPKLKKVDDGISVPNARHFHIPELEEVGWNIFARDLEFFSAPSLTKIGSHISAESARSFKVAKLEEVGEFISAGFATEVDISSLKNGGRLSFKKVENFNAPQLVEATSLQLDAAITVNMPSLIEVEEMLYAWQAEKFSAPRLQTVGSTFHIHNAEEVDVSSLEEVSGDFLVNNAYTLLAPKLHTIGGSFAHCHNPDRIDISSLTTVNTKSYEPPHPRVINKK